MQRVLHFIIDCAWPAISGGDIRNEAIQQAFCPAAYHCICLAPPSHPPPVSCYTLRQYQSGTLNPWRNVEADCPTVLSFPAESLREIEEQAQQFRPDLVLLSGVAFARLMTLDCFRGLPVILDMANVESLLFAEQMRSRPWLKRVRGWFRANRRLLACQQADVSTSWQATQTWACSPVDAQRLRQLGGRVDQLIPNPIPDESLFDLAIEVTRYERPRSLFVGHLSYFPNVAAVQELASLGLPKSRPADRVSLTIAGRSPGRAIRKLADQGVFQLIADPQTLRPLLAEHGYTLLPIRQGSGTRLKVLEAMAAGLVVIACDRAVEGLDLIPGVHYIAAQSLVEMNQQLQTLVKQPQRAQAIARQGRQFVQAGYTRQVIHQRIATALSELPPPATHSPASRALRSAQRPKLGSPRP